MDDGAAAITATQQLNHKTSTRKCLDYWIQTHTRSTYSMIAGGKDLTVLYKISLRRQTLSNIKYFLR